MPSYPLHCAQYTPALIAKGEYRVCTVTVVANFTTMTYFEKKHQLDFLRLYMIAHRKFAVQEALGKIYTINSDPFAYYHWNEVTDILNGFGPKQKAYEWKYIWKCICFRVFGQLAQDSAKLTWQDQQIVRLLESEIKLELVAGNWYFLRRRNAQVMELTEEERKNIYRIETESLWNLRGENSGTETNMDTSNDANTDPQQNVDRKNFTQPPDDEIDECNDETGREESDEENGQENSDYENEQVENNEENGQNTSHEENEQVENNEENGHETSDEENEQVEHNEENGHENSDDENEEVETNVENSQKECDMENGQGQKNDEIVEEDCDEDKEQLENNEEDGQKECDEENGQVQNNEEDDHGKNQSRRVRAEQEPIDFRVQANGKKSDKKAGQEGPNKRKDREFERNKSNSQDATNRSPKRQKPETTTELAEIVPSKNIKIEILRDIADTMKSIAVTFPQVANALIAALERN